MLFDFSKLGKRYAFYGVHGCALYKRALLLRKKLHALRRAVGALVVLTRKIRNGKNLVVLGKFNLFEIDVVYGRLGEYARHSRLKFRL